MQLRTCLELLESRRLLTSDLVADFQGIYPTDAVSLDGISYFAAADVGHGKELWRSDGTHDGTALVRDVLAGATGSKPQRFTVLDDRLLFFADNADGTVALWRTDGTSGGTSKLADLNGTGMVSPTALVNGRTVFVVTNERHGGTELWSSDGTAAGTTRLAHLFDDILLMDYGMRDPIVVNGRAILAVGGDLWSTDGTVAGTIQMNDRSNTARIPSTFAITTLDGAAVAITSRQANVEIWRTDGTIAGSSRLQIFFNSGLNSQIVTSGGEAYFQLWDAETDKHYLGVTDGTGTGTKRLKEIGGGGTIQPLPDGRVVMAVTSHGTPIEIWTSDGTADGTAHQATLTAGANASSGLVMAGGIGFVFICKPGDDDPIAELWRTDGTPGGTQLVQDLVSTGAADIDKYIDVTLTDVGGKLAVKTPQETLVFDPATMATPVGPRQGSITLVDGIMRIFGTRHDDLIKVYQHPADPDRFVVNLNGATRSYAISAVRKLVIYGYSGDDNIAFNEKLGFLTIRSLIWSGDGDDTVYGGSGNDTIFGEGGDDHIDSGRRNDSVAGGNGNDWIYGSSGADTVSGGGGSDRVNGGAGNDLIGGGADEIRDSLISGAGEDVIFGQPLFDIFYDRRNDDGSDAIIEI
jgi:ELWxxDGT repeat protein